MYDYRRVDTSKDHVSAVTTFPKGPPHFCSSSYIRFPAFVSLFFLFSLLSNFEQQLRYLDDRRGLLHCPPPPYHYGISTSCLPKQTKIKRPKKCRPKMYLLLLLFWGIHHHQTIPFTTFPDEWPKTTKSKSKCPYCVMYAQQRSHGAVQTPCYLYILPLC